MYALLVALLLIVVSALPFVLVAWVTPEAPVIIETHNARVAYFPEGTIRYDDEGAGDKAIVLLHGFNGQLAHWNQVWDRLDTCGRRLRLDIPGFGGSEWNTQSYTLQEQAQRVVAFLDSRGVKTATLVGGSMGGSLAAWIAAYYPQRVDQVGLLAPSGYTEALRYPGLFGMILGPGWLNDQATVVARSRAYAALFPRSKALQALTVTASYGPGWVKALARIRAPTLVLWSQGDEGVSHTTAQSVRQAIPGSTLIWLDKQTGHLISRTRPALVADLVCQLASGVKPADIARRLPPPLLHQGEG